MSDHASSVRLVSVTNLLYAHTSQSPTTATIPMRMYVIFISASIPYFDHYWTVTVACAEVVAPEDALQSSVNRVVVARASVDVEPRVPVAIKKRSGAKSSQSEV